MKITNFGKGNYKRIKHILWEKDKFCCYCGIETVIIDNFQPKKGVPTPPNLATVEHVYGRLCELPRIPFNEKKISCYDCNVRKGLRDDKMYRKLGHKIPIDVYERLNFEFTLDRLI